MVVVPGTMPVTVPVKVPMEAIPGALLDQLPPKTISERVTGIPTQIVDGPMIGPGAGLTVTMVAVWHPVVVNV
jgi:hypothetical protein